MASFKSKKLERMHDRAKKNFDLAYEYGDEIRGKIIEARRFALVPGAQWEGSTDGGYEFGDKFDLYPKFELNKVARECDRIISEYRNNRITIKFRPKDTMASEELAEKLNGRFRADFEESSGGEALDNAFDGSAYGGFGCFRLDAVYEDEMDPINESQRICFKPVYDPETCVWFDQNSKEYDRSDAMWAMEVFSMTPDAFEDEYPDAEVSSLEVSDDGSQYDWYAPDAIYVGRYYEVRIENVTLMSYRHPVTGEVATYSSDTIEEVIDELEESDFQLVAERKVKMRRVYCGLMSGEEWLEAPERIPGEHIPLIPVYGKRHFVDNKERIEGHVAKAMDAQRLENLMVSMMADNATLAGGDNIPIVNIDGIPKSLTHLWGERNTNRPAYLPTTTLRDKKTNAVIQADTLVGNTGVTQMSPALAGLLQYTGQAIQQITGSSMLENIPSNIATDTVDSIFNRMDTQSFIYMDNMAKSLRRAGVVYMSMAREVYGSDRPMRIVNEDGTDDMTLMSGSVIDRQTGQEVALADLTMGQYEVTVDVGKSFATRRDATVRQLTEIQQRIPPQHPYFGLIMGMIIDNMDGEGIDDLKDYNRQQMLLQGVVKPRTPEEEQMVMQAQMAQANQPDPDMVIAAAQDKLAMAELKKADNESANVNIKAYTASVDAQLKQAQTVKAFAEAENISNDQVRQALKLIHDYNKQQQDSMAKMNQQFVQ